MSYHLEIKIPNPRLPSAIFNLCQKPSNKNLTDLVEKHQSTTLKELCGMVEMFLPKEET
jgi:hypothetical protein